jgi:Dolichyl-phosphate-mannose-protein mannosyltransferase
MAAIRRGSRGITLAGLGLLIALGAYLRLSDIGMRTISHVEMYVPGIRMPEGISVPRERLTLPSVLSGTFSSDTHPPGYYVLMWGWTKCFGTSPTAMRLPSALFGIACIPLMFWLGVLTQQRAAGWIASGLLAVNGQHVVWSELARMYSLACFLGLLATILLLLMAKNATGTRGLGFLYVLVILLGVSVHIFFWLLLGTHILWTLLNAWSERLPFPGAGRFQILALILGSPFLASAAYQTGNTLSGLDNAALIFTREFLQFGFLFPLEGYSAMVRPQDPSVAVVDHPYLSIARWLFLLLSVLLVVVGMISMGKPKDKLLAGTPGPSWRSWVSAAGLATVLIAGFVFMAKVFAKPRPNPTLKIAEAMIVLPFAMSVLAILLEKSWNRLTGKQAPVLGSRFLIGEQALVLDLAFLPFLVLVVVSQFKPLLNARGLLLLVPYLLLVLAWGIVRASRHRPAAALLLLVLGVAHYASLKEYKDYNTMVTGGANYKAFAEALVPHIEKSDLIFLYPSFSTTPIFYYLHDDQYRLVGQDYEAACRQNPRSRVWALWFYEQPVPKDMEEALSNYQSLQTFQERGAKAVLYAPPNF